jgi:hypothetical protein
VGVIGAPDDAGVVLGSPSVVADLELLEADHLLADPARQPVGGRRADATEPEHRVLEVALHDLPCS